MKYQALFHQTRLSSAAVVIGAKWVRDILAMAYKRPGPGCSKLTTSLVNVSLNFQ